MDILVFQPSQSFEDVFDPCLHRRINAWRPSTAPPRIILPHFGPALIVILLIFDHIRLLSRTRPRCSARPTASTSPPLLPILVILVGIIILVLVFLVILLLLFVFRRTNFLDRRGLGGRRRRRRERTEIRQFGVSFRDSTSFGKLVEFGL